MHSKHQWCLLVDFKGLVREKLDTEDYWQDTRFTEPKPTHYSCTLYSLMIVLLIIIMNKIIFHSTLVIKLHGSRLWIPAFKTYRKLWILKRKGFL